MYHIMCWSLSPAVDGVEINYKYRAPDVQFQSEGDWTKSTMKKYEKVGGISQWLAYAKNESYILRELGLCKLPF